MQKWYMHKLLLDIPSKLETERLIIRPYRKGDGAAYFSLLQNNRDHLKEHLDEATTIKTEEEAEIKVREHHANWVARNSFVMGVWKKESIYIGEMWMGPVKWDVPSFEIGWFLGKTYQGKGFATEAVKRCLVFLFEDLKAHKVIVKARETNVRSYKLAERCGFVKEGLLRDNAKVDDGWVGLLCYGMLKSEYVLQKN
jgi:RimJ/RimL family protein N-acetyltransferase